jgi:hypothetical protein
MHEEIVQQAISGNKSIALTAFDRLVNSCQMTPEIAEKIRDEAELRVISNRAAKFNGHPTRVIEYTIYTIITIATIGCLSFFALHVYKDVQERKVMEQNLERP